MAILDKGHFYVTVCHQLGGVAGMADLDLFGAMEGLTEEEARL